VGKIKKLPILQKIGHISCNENGIVNTHTLPTFSSSLESVVCSSQISPNKYIHSTSDKLKFASTNKSRIDIKQSFELN
jgi:hypothetical protein